MPGLLDWQDPAQAGNLGLAAGLLGRSGPQRQPVSFGQSLSAGLLTSQQMQLAAQQAMNRSGLADAQTKQLLLENEALQRNLNAPPKPEYKTLAPGANLLSIGPDGRPQNVFSAPFAPKDSERWGPPEMMGGALVQRNLDTGQIRQAVSRPPQVNVNVPVNLAQNAYASKVGGLSGDRDVSQLDTASSASDNISKLDLILNQLKSSDAITGPGADILLQAERAKQFFTQSEASGKKVSDTQLLDSLLGSDVFPMIKSLGIGARGLDTPAEREFLRSVMTGSINLNKDTLVRMTEIRKNVAERAVKKWNARVDSGELDKFFEASQTPKAKIPLPDSGWGIVK